MAQKDLTLDEKMTINVLQYIFYPKVWELYYDIKRYSKAEDDDDRNLYIEAHRKPKGKRRELVHSIWEAFSERHDSGDYKTAWLWLLFIYIDNPRSYAIYKNSPRKKVSAYRFMDINEKNLKKWLDEFDKEKAKEIHRWVKDAESSKHVIFLNDLTRMAVFRIQGRRLDSDPRIW